MVAQLRWPILGIIVPCVLIAGIGYGSHLFVLRHSLSHQKQIAFEVSLSLLWISYLFAIHVDPGYPPDNFEPRPGEWRRWCKKCQNYKPERSHHCKTCNRCVLQMDHHCPWTYNCVGAKNMGHFMRFLFWILVNTGFVFIELSKRAMEFYEDRNLPAYLIDKKELVAVIVLLPLDIFVNFAILILFVRCLSNWVFKGMTQIEQWEHERIESQLHTERMWLQIRKNYIHLHGHEMPVLTSWNQNARFYSEDRGSEEEADELDYVEDVDNASSEYHQKTSVVPQDFTIDDFVFPYDLGIVKNAINTFNYPWMWLFPWTSVRQSGYRFEKNEYAEDDQVGLPWPPDGGHQEYAPDPDIDLDNLDVSELRNLRQLKKRLDPRSKLDRKDWVNGLGETLGDYGVDLDAEDVENDQLVMIK
ncbi:Palmitoyltransferase PFA4 [Yamadazyma tenuis ATCC 10573]|uniref:Palmitoyltransferase PFA4 n=1 Tax=Candida tenuis (strain ATCC 10573 / BCRC 21748 / CBS 615 / JCM 9827 / NBRC 10315 / NRRL Y-1498 / VKM Y-70) TaxID=590646 RepID=G3B1G9_CANTC|nr:uncharacterized protein CANTEDRAFT_121225 [Yamadazyma tenuis ATCC 10573]XP_006685776.1 Palmitoyltransferase PFA4 [Yamadazyma tenuis ATCC 10573]EGV64969.1 hypothetical protein CANTEDRAFT_121225 [Yamadazyma tenuis ATCC 10573]EGV64970.1 Palmitoyltransferase PFA4 [Yamadazyma tenuis ATCC 10573]